MSIINICLAGHKTVYTITSRQVFEKIKYRNNNGNWKCPECLAKLKDMEWKE